MSLLKAHGNTDGMSRLPLPVQPAPIPEPPGMILLMEQLEKSPITATNITAANIQNWANTDPLLPKCVV